MLGKFLSADPFIQLADELQSYNRYSYVLNNPLSLTDPDGFFFKSLFKAIKKLFTAITRVVKAVLRALPGPLRTLLAIAIAAIPGPNASLPAILGSGFAAGFVASGGDLKAGIVGALTAGAFNFAGDIFTTPLSNALAHGVVGGAANVAMGGDFVSGFTAGSFGSFASNFNFGSGGANLVAATVAGGVGAVLGGGKFINGAWTGAFGYLYNKFLHNPFPNLDAADVDYGEMLMAVDAGITVAGIAAGGAPGLGWVAVKRALAAGFKRFFISSRGVAGGTTGVGRYAGESIAARSSARDFKAVERTRIDEFGARTGCHTNPGTKSGHFVPDHQPPTALNPPGAPQRLYPQCINCSREQGLEIARQLQQGGL